MVSVAELPTVASADTKRWRLIDQLVDQALALGGSARQDFLDGLAPNRSKRVRAWLAAMEADSPLEGSLDDCAIDLVHRVLDDISALLPGERLGSYQVTELLGEGGMGSVFRARRVEGDFEHQVAVKILRKEMAGSVLADRFAREREILASLDHPHIAKLLDGGSTAEGLPYFVLDLVEGAESITDYCDQTQLDTSSRVRLFLDVCDAVHAAHRNLIIHRDLKPSNVLVNDEGRVMLVDFGIAKPIGPQAKQDELVTQIPAFTPLSASPEQMTRQPVGTTSDIYQLGLLLYELLSGLHPHRLETSSDNLYEVITESRAPAPSAALRRYTSQTGSQQQPIDGGQVLPPGKLAGLLQGDLDAIVQMALHKQPEHRYQTADELGQDLEAWLNGEPVSAQPDSAGYKFRKWTARNPALTMVSALGVLSILATVVLSLAFARSTQRQSIELEGERDLARETSQLMTELFEAASPRQRADLTDGVTAVEVLDRGATRLRERFGQERPQLLAEMFRALARSNVRLGRYDQAEDLLAEALELDQSQGEDGRLGVAIDLSRLAELESDQFNYTEAAAQSLQAQAAFEALDSPPPEEVARATIIRSFSSIMASQTPNRAHLETLERVKEQLDQNWVHDAELTMAYRKFADFGPAIRINEELLQVQEKESPGSLDLAATLNSLACARQENGDPDAAIESYERSTDILRQLLGPGHPRTLTTLRNLGRAHSAAGQFDLELDRHQELVDVTRESFPNHWRLASALEDLAWVLLKQGRHQEAAETAKEAYEGYVSTLGADHDWLVLPGALIGLASVALGERQTGLEWLDRSATGYGHAGVENVRGQDSGIEQIVRNAEKLGLTEVSARFGKLIAPQASSL